jgi:hypothetical protein
MLELSGDLWKRLRRDGYTSPAAQVRALVRNIVRPAGESLSIWIAGEDHTPPEEDPGNGAVDVIVTRDDGSRWSATFLAYRYLDTLRRRNAATGECLAGKYFWAADAIFIEDVSRASIEAAVADLLREGEFDIAFRRIPEKAKRRRSSRAKRGVTTQVGYTNRNRQTVVRPTGLPGTDHLQSIYVLHCGDCGNEYGSNGSDNHQRKCPACQGGMPGLKF